jgi:methionyl-tRNA formyltransferase
MKINFIFLGTDKFSTTVLDKLKERGYIPSLIITAPDARAGRGNKLKEPDVKLWAKDNNIEVIQPHNLNDDFINQIKEENWDLFILASYGKIVPQSFLDIPDKGTLNVHPSLLPKYRGASPIETAILNDDKETGVTIMLMDEKMDHGSIINQEVVEFKEWENKEDVELKLANIGGEMLANSIEPWVREEIKEQDQDHSVATFTKKINKEDGLINIKDLDSKGEEIYLKYLAYNPWPGIYFYINHNDRDVRVKITEAKYEDNVFEILKVIPEGKKEMDYESFKKGYCN